MRTTLVILAALLISCASTQHERSDRGLWHAKAESDVQHLVDRYAETPIDSTVTLQVVPTQMWVDAERQALVAQCQLQLADRLDSVVMVICPTRSIPCLGASPLVESIRLSPPWSPGL